MRTEEPDKDKPLGFLSTDGLVLVCTSRKVWVCDCLQRSAFASLYLAYPEWSKSGQDTVKTACLCKSTTISHWHRTFQTEPETHRHRQALQTAAQYTARPLCHRSFQCTSAHIAWWLTPDHPPAELSTILPAIEAAHSMPSRLCLNISTFGSLTPTLMDSTLSRLSIT